MSFTPDELHTAVDWLAERLAEHRTSLECRVELAKVLLASTLSLMSRKDRASAVAQVLEWMVETSRPGPRRHLPRPTAETSFLVH
jgi:hypothetical protein